jgi:uncharacterized protein with FMN-binding domain
MERISIMATHKSSSALGAGRTLRKSLVSGFVLASYLAYAVHEHFAAPSQTASALPLSAQPGQIAQALPQNQTASGLSGQNQTAQAALSQGTSGGQYKNGTFTGVSANAFYGQVQVQVSIQNGQISAVKFLNFPQDRRTSQRINSVAVPQLQSEAIQAQSAQVDVVSGATLTSQAFMASLESALSSAQG